MTVKVTTMVQADPAGSSETVVVLSGVADEALVAMLADGLRRLTTVTRRLAVDASDLLQPTTETGRSLLEELLGPAAFAGGG